MHRSAWIALAALVACGLLGALALWLVLDDGGKPKALVAPRGATVLENLPLRGPFDQRVVTWRLGGQAEDPASGLYGVTIRQGKRTLWGHRARTGALGVHVETGDFSGDGADDVLVFDDTDGSGGCGTYRALVSAPAIRPVLVRLLCEDQGTIHLRADGLHVRLGVRRDPKTAQQTHCCYLFARTTVLRWDGRTLTRVRTSLRRLSRSHPWPPGGYPPGERA